MARNRWQLAASVVLTLACAACSSETPPTNPVSSTSVDSRHVVSTQFEPGSNAGTSPDPGETASSETAAESDSGTPSTSTTATDAAATPAPESESTSESTNESPTAPGTSTPPTEPTSIGELTVADLATGLTTPWGIAFLPDGSALVTERDTGMVRAVAADGTVSGVGTVAGVESGGEAGLLGIAVSPQFADDATVFVYYTAADDNRIARITLAGGTLSDQQDIVTGIPKAGNHDGGRIIVGPDGLLYVGTGDAGNGSGAQDLGYLGGKILRINPDGSGAEGNPFPDAPLVYSYGHRNVQGLAFDPAGRLWAAEFGQNTWDELNLIAPGGNYGWPDAEGATDNPEFVTPQRVWSTDQASPSGIAIWRGSVWMAGLRGQTLWQIPITDPTDGPPVTDPAAAAATHTAEPIAHFAGEYGRLRTVLAAPDGSLWLSTSNTDGRGSPTDTDDRILRITSD